LPQAVLDDVHAGQVKVSRSMELLRRARGDRVDFTVITMWEPPDAILTRP